MSQQEKLAVLQGELQALVGLSLSIARNAANMKVFHFGPIRPHRSGRGTVGSYALHLQCPWRIVTDTGIVTGSADLYMEPEAGGELDEQDFQSGTLQHVRLAALLKGYDPATRSFVNATDTLVVLSVTVDPYGGAELLLSSHYRLQIFPSGSRGEDWRFIDMAGRDIVIEGGQIDILA